MAINNFNVGVGTTSQLTRYRYVATGGETSISGTDADGKTLSYTVGLEQVFLNGVNLVRGQDYTATNGTSIGSLTALVASDSLEVFAYVPFNIANALTVSTVDAKGDLLVGTGADAVGRLAVGTANQLLAVDSSTASGLKWANPGMTYINTTTFSSVSSVSLPDNTFTSTYKNYKILLRITANTADALVYLKLRATTDASTAYYFGWAGSSATDVQDWSAKANQTTGILVCILDGGSSGAFNASDINLYSPLVADRTPVTFTSVGNTTSGNVIGFAGGGFHATQTAYNAASFVASSGNITGEIVCYGYNQ